MTASAPGSLLRTARTAEESKTVLLILFSRGLATAVFDQFINEADPFGHKLAHDGSRSFHGCPTGQKIELAVINRCDQNIALGQSQCFAKRRRNDDTAVWAETELSRLRTLF